MYLHTPKLEPESKPELESKFEPGLALAHLHPHPHPHQTQLARTHIQVTILINYSSNPI